MIFRSKNLNPGSISSKADADKLFRPYLSVSIQESSAAGPAAEGAATGAAVGGAGSAGEASG
ncbi:unnamed protein product [Ectocarpus sp. CCAP 1310/34]|nr:unnamed protein product [Ectocarpus sp. CCAP 1310/34]